ncbi:MAG: PIG-L deacetylase family protein [Anaerolineales bacterium]|jgi:LmbE family N-acetylglucosaminyl deacetylase
MAEEIFPGVWETPQKILVILAHPDDPEFFCGGTVAQWTAAGHHVRYCVMTCGDKGSDEREVSTDELCATRHVEQRAAARVLGVEAVRFLEYPDGYLVPDLALRKEITRVIRQERPDILVTCDPTNLFIRDTYINHPDHRAAGQVVLDAVFPAAGNHRYFPELLEKEGLETHMPHEVWISLPVNPQVDIDITAVFAQKVKALLEHRSQIGDPDEFVERMYSRYTEDSTPESPRFVERYRVVRYA